MMTSNLNLYLEYLSGGNKYVQMIRKGKLSANAVGRLGPILDPKNYTNTAKPILVSGLLKKLEVLRRKFITPIPKNKLKRIKQYDKSDRFEMGREEAREQYKKIMRKLEDLGYDASKIKFNW